jgi:hypothetical protein
LRHIESGQLANRFSSGSSLSANRSEAELEAEAEPHETVATPEAPEACVCEYEGKFRITCIIIIDTIILHIHTNDAYT